MPEELWTKAGIAYLIVQVISKSHLTQKDAAEVRV